MKSKFPLIALLLILGAILSTPAGAAGKNKDKKSDKDAVQTIFPEPPDPARIKWIRNIKTQSDLKGGGEKSFGKFVSFLAGGDAGAALAARPYGVWVKGDDIYLTDSDGGKALRMNMKTAKVKTFGEGAGEDGLKTPIGVTVDSDGNVYVTDTGDHTIKAFDADGKLLWKKDHLGEGQIPLKKPAGISWTKEGDILVLDSGNKRVVVLGKDGAFKRVMLRNMDDPFALPFPQNLWVEPNGEFMISDPLLARVHIFTSTGGYISGFGEPGDGVGYLARPRGVASDSDGNIYVVDAIFNRVQIFNRKGQVLLPFASPGDKPGQLSLPAGIFIDPSDRIYVVDANNRRVAVYQYLKAAGKAEETSPSHTD